MHSLHKSQYCLSCESYFTGGTLAGQHFCGKVELNDKKKSSPLYTKVLTEKKAKFICRYCSKSFVRQAYYEEHELKHRVVTHHRCDCCGLYFPNAHKCQSHKHKATCTPLILDPFLQTADHSESIPEKNARLPFSCRFCGRAFASPDSLKKHLRLHKGNKPFRCLDCGKNFARHGHLMAHKNVHRRNIQCSVCWEVLPSIGDLLKHRQSHPKKGMLKCPDCPLQFQFPVFLLRHVAVHERRRKLKELVPPKDQATPQKVEEIYKEEFKCGLCQEAFVDSKALSEHCLTHMPGPSASKCQFCKRHFSSRAGLIRHIRLHTGEKPFPCPTCGRHFHRKEVLKLHQEKFYNCSYCPHSFRFPNNLKLHERAHLAKTVFPCSKCGKTYSTKKTLRTHNLTIRCKKISKESVPSAKNDVQTQPCRETSKLLQRIQVHYMNKFKYQCEYCPRRFKLSGQLKVHVRLHTGEKPYGCANCGEHFIRTDYLKRHLAKCSGKGEKEKILCDKCGDLFTRDALSVHQKTQEPHQDKRFFLC
uniref:Uncharacterized LOC107714742 n=1 Tax=Sinocyclocheilus rhinocerous TaxID=307959 RepID=A0A673GRK4_9TELE